MIISFNLILISIKFLLISLFVYLFICLFVLYVSFVVIMLVVLLVLWLKRKNINSIVNKSFHKLKTFRKSIRNISKENESNGNNI